MYSFVYKNADAEDKYGEILSTDFPSFLRHCFVKISQIFNFSHYSNYSLFMCYFLRKVEKQ